MLFNVNGWHIPLENPNIIAHDFNRGFMGVNVANEPYQRFKFGIDLPKT